MNDRADRLIDAIGKVDDKYIRKSMPMTGVRSEINNEITEDITMEKISNGLIEITVERPSPKQIRNRRIRIAAVSGLAAAVVISGGVFVWNKLGGLKDPFTHGASVTTDNNNNPEREYVPDVRNLRWGMTVDEVKAHETATLSDTFNREDSTELIYYPVEFEGCDTEMQLNVAKDIGFYNVIYNIRTSEETTGRKEDVYKKLYDLSVGRYGLPDNSDGITWASWYIPEKNTEFEVSLDENTNIVEYWVKWVHDTSSLPVMRGLRWGMTLDEVKENELEFDAAEEEGEDYTGNARTLLTYNEVKYKGYYTKLTLCVEDQNGLTGINYRVDTQAYPDALNTLKADFEKKYGKCKESYGSCEWSMPQVGLTVMLFDYEQTVQVGIYPYIGNVTDNNGTEVTPPSDRDDSEFTDENEMDINTWKPLDDVSLDIYPSDLPKTLAEYQSAGLPADFDWDDFAEKGYPRVMLSSVPNADADGKYDVYLLTGSVYGDEDDDNIVRGTMMLGVAEHGSDKLFALENIQGDFGVRMIIDQNKLGRYLQIFNIKGASGENNMVIKTAYGENDREYRTEFWYIKDGELNLFYKIAGYVGSDPSVSDMEGTRMKLYSKLEQEGDEIVDNRNGMRFFFDFENDEIKIDTFIVADDGSGDDEPQQPVSSEPAEGLKTFNIATHNFISHEINPGERSLFDSDLLVAGHTAYTCMDRWLNIASLLAEAKNSLGVNYAGFEEAVKPYCNENGGLDHEKAVAVPKTPTSSQMFEETEYFSSSYEYRVLNDNWLIGFNEQEVSIYMKDDKLTGFRRAAEYLWSVFDEYPDMAVTAIYNYETKEAYLQVVSDDCPKINTAMQRDCGNDAAACCRFMTSFDAKTDWLPVTMLKESGGETYINHVEQLDIYNVAFDNGVYTGASMESASETADRLKELGMTKESRALLKETANIPETVKSQKELAKTLHENIKSFEQVMPYASVFDPVKLPRYYDVGFSCYYSIGSQVLEVMASPRDADHADYEIHYRLLQFSDILTKTRYIVTHFRDNYIFSDPSNGYSGYVIKGIEVISTSVGLETKWQVRLIADESMWEEIERANGEGLHLTQGELIYASEPAVTA